MPLCGFLETIAEIVAVRAQQKRLVLNYVAAPDLPAVVRVDERRLRQVLLNLLANAVQFTDRGEVTLSVSRGAAGRLRFEVRDTGIGVSADRLEAIFQPFEQAGDHTRRSGGAGLGLAISQQLVRMMGGEIEVTSSAGEGSVFGFELDAPASAAWIGVPVGTPMSMPGWQASHARRSQNGEVIGPFTGQISRPEPCFTGPLNAFGAAFWISFWMRDC